MASLKTKTINGMFWSFLQSVGGNGIQFVVMLLLARLLLPEDFGLIGLLAVFIQLSQVLIQAGFNQALIQKQGADEEDFSSVFWINLAVSLLIYTVLFFVAPLVAKFYDQQVLTTLLRVLSLVFVINAFSYVQEARLSKEMRFKTLTVVSIPSTVLGGIVSVVMAIKGFGVWSLVVLQITTRLSYAVQIWFWAKWKPLLIFKKEKALNLFFFGGKLMLSAVINTIFQNAYVIIIGKFFPISAVGYYQNSLKMVRTPSLSISNAVGKVTFPMFSSIQHDNNRLKEGLKKINQQILFWICPVFIIAGVMAAPLFELILGEKWLPAVPYFQWLCVVGIFYPLSVYNLNVINAKGKSGVYLKLTIIKKAVFVIALISAIPFGIWGLLAVQAFNVVFAFILNSYYLGKYIDYPLWKQIKDILPILVLSIFVGVLVYLIELLGLNSCFLRLLLGGGIGIIFYYTFSRLFQLSPLLDFQEVFKRSVMNKFIKANRE